MSIFNFEHIKFMIQYFINSEHVLGPSSKHLLVQYQIHRQTAEAAIEAVKKTLLKML